MHKLYTIFNDQSSNNMLTNDIISFEQLGPELYQVSFTELAQRVVKVKVNGFNWYISTILVVFTVCTSLQIVFS